jgi:hypothetical protein
LIDAVRTRIAQRCGLARWMLYLYYEGCRADAWLHGVATCKELTNCLRFADFGIAQTAYSALYICTNDGYVCTMRCRFFPVFAAVLAYAVLAYSEHAAAQCSPGDALLSEARAARWLVADDIVANATLDHERFTRPLPKEKPKFSALAFAGLTYQSVESTICTNRGVEEGSLRRVRFSAGVGLAHSPSGVELRFSVLHGRDSLVVPTVPNDDDAEEASAGYGQTLFALRFGHEKWLRALVGFVDPDSGFRNPRAGVAVSAPLAGGSSATSVYLGAGVPVLGLHVVSLLRAGQPEFVNVSVRERRLGSLPIAASFFPTYVREERRVFGTARLHLLTSREIEKARNSSEAPIYLENTTGVLLEGAVEARDARLRYARLRYATSVAGPGVKFGIFELAGYLEATVFRSAFFSNTKVLGTGNRRGTAWGGGLGVTSLLHTMNFGIVFDASAGFNRPELLQILPSGQNQFEFRFAAGLRFDTN